MGIQIHHLLGETPDRVVSVDRGDGKMFIWSFKDKSSEGLNVKIQPCDEDGWVLSIYSVQWSGSEFVESDDPKCECVLESLNKSITKAENRIKSLCENNPQLVPCEMI